MKYFAAIILSGLLAMPAQAEVEIIYQGGGLQRWQPQYSMRIADGYAQLNQYSAAVSPDMVNEEDLILAERDISEQEVTELLAKITATGFFKIDPEALPESAEMDMPQGNYALLRVTQDGEVHELSADNMAIPALNSSIAALQGFFPNHKLPVPEAVCDTGDGVMATPPLKKAPLAPAVAGDRSGQNAG